MSNKKPFRRKWKISKIKALNYLIWGAFIVSLIYKIVSSVLFESGIWNEVEHFDLTNIHTWHPMDYVLTISGFVIIIELTALLRERGVDMVSTAREIKDLTEKEEEK